MTRGSKLRMEAAPASRPMWTSYGVRHDVAERVPPTRLASLRGQLDQPIPFGAGDAVKLEQRADVTGLRPAPAGLDVEDGGG